MSYFDPLKVKVIALSGGVGGAKLVLGLSKIMQPGELLVVTNTGDDFDHYGLRICPDTDTVFYSLAGLADTKRGWGRKTETWNFLGALKQLNGEDWFQLGDKDLALHMIRTQLLSRGISLSKVTETLSSIMGIKHPLVPVTDDHLRTIVITPEGPVPFQNYFVKDQCRARVTGFKFEGAYSARPNSFLVQTLEKNSLEAIIFCPSNPYVSLDPILSIRELRRLIAENKAPKIGVSPIISGKAVKGPAAKMMKELGFEVSAYTFAAHYAREFDGVVIDKSDRAERDRIRKLKMSVALENTLMKTIKDKSTLARKVMEFSDLISSASQS